MDIKRGYDDHIDGGVIPVSLPEDIVRQILVRLTVKALVRFRYVSKSWLTLISDPIFVHKHLRASIQDEGYAHHKLIMTSDCRPFDVKSCSIASILHGEFSNMHDHYYPSKHPYCSVLIIGSVNGLVCIVIDKKTVFIWNPSTRESKRLPDCGFKKSLGGSIVYGFGYDEGNSEYKVMVFNSPTAYHPKTVVKIYGLKSESWRKIDDLPKQTVSFWNASSMFVSGSLHLIPSGNGWNPTKPICSFDLSKETYSEFSQPPYGVGATISIIGVLCESLCILCNMGSSKRTDVWAMKEYGKVESWSKLFTIPYYWGHLGFGTCQFYTPLWISFRKDEMVLVFGSLFMVYNINNNEICKTNIRDFLDGYSIPRLHAFTYIESLVSP